MEVVKDHLALPNPRFRCRDTSETLDLTVPLAHLAGAAATEDQLTRLRELAGAEADALEPLYRSYDGAAFHVNGETAGLVIASVDELPELNSDWREWFEDWEAADLYEFQKEGFAFATIAASGNYFVIHHGKVYYSDHDGGDDAVWGETLEGFLRRALGDPARFLDEVGCYTRYSDGTSEAQYIPESFEHD